MRKAWLSRLFGRFFTRENASSDNMKKQKKGRVAGQDTPFREVFTLVEAFPDNDVAHDITSEPFRVFSQGYKDKSDIAAMYADFLQIKTAFFPKAVPENTVKAPQDSTQTACKTPETVSGFEQIGERLHPESTERSYSGFAGRSAVIDYGASLSARQMQIAKQSGMSYREYAELLGTLPEETASFARRKNKITTI